jgi:NitT/TauT family transport system substrate-binding protein
VRLYRSWLVLLVIFGVVLAACGTGSTSTEPSTSAAAQSEEPEPTGSESIAPEPSEDPVAGQTVRVVYASEGVGINDFITKLAFDALAERGLEVEYQFVAEDTLGVQAVIRGDAELAGGTPPVTINAHEQSSDIQFLAQYNRQAWSLASTSDITEVEQLEGKTIAVHGETSFTKTVADLIIEEYGLQDVEVIIIPGSDVRAQALLSGQIDATVLDIQDVALASNQEPGAINVLVRFSQLFPELTSVRFTANRNWIDANPELAREIVKALVVANREAVDDPDGTVAAAQAYYDDQDPDVVEAIIRAFIEGDHWVLDGGMSEENALSELQFYLDAGQTTLEPTAENVESLYRLDILNDVLDELGRVED